MTEQLESEKWLKMHSHEFGLCSTCRHFVACETANEDIDALCERGLQIPPLVVEDPIVTCTAYEQRKETTMPILKLVMYVRELLSSLLTKQIRHKTTQTNKDVL